MEKIKAIVFLVLIALAFSCANTKKSVDTKKVSTQEPNKTNVLWIITDEHNFRTIGAYRDQLSEDQAFVWGKMPM